MNVKIELTHHISNWDKLLEKYRGSLFLSTSWLESIKSKDKVPVYFLFKMKDQILGLIAGLERPVGKGPEKQLFFFSGIAIFSNNAELLKACKRELMKYAKENSFYRVIIKSYDCTKYTPAYVKGFVPFEREEFVIDLTVEKEKIINNVAKRYRRYIKKAIKKGAEFGFSNSEKHLDTLFYLMGFTQEKRISKGYENYNMLTMPLMSPEDIKKLLKNQTATLYYIKFNGNIVSIQLVLTAVKRAYGVYMGTHPDGYKISAPSVLYHLIALKYKDGGYFSYNLGGIPLGAKNKGLKRIKSFMGASSVKSKEETTDFLLPPLSGLNKYLILKRKLSGFPLPWRIKKLILRMIDHIIKGRDKY